MYTMNTQPTSLREYLDSVLFPALYEVLDQEGIFEEFNFKRNGAKYQSTTTTKITGRTGKTKGQVYVYANRPSMLIDHSEGSIDFIDYIINTRRTTFYQAIGELRNIAGVGAFHYFEQDQEIVERERRKAKIWEAVINYCIQCIRSPQYKDEAKDLIDYLTLSRKYTYSDIEALQLGYLPNQKALFEKLKEEGFTEEDVAEIKLPSFAGATHKLTIPIRNRRGQAIGLAIRDVNYKGEGAKYLYNIGLKKNEALFNLYTKAHEGRVVLTEGQLDAGIVTARGYSWASVAAIGGKAISDQQVDHLLKAGAKEVFIALDNEAATEADVQKTIKKLAAIEQLEDRIYIVVLPSGVKDIDELVTKEGLEAFEAIVKKAQAYYLYNAEKRIEEFKKQITTEGHSDRALNNLIDDIVIIAASTHNPIRREDLKGLFILLLQEGNIQADQSVFIEAVDRIRYNAAKEKQKDDIKKLSKEAEGLIAEGKIEEAIDLYKNKIRNIELRDKRTEYEQLEAIQRTEEAIRERIKLQPEGVKTGYKILIEGIPEDILLPAGQLSFIAAPSNHGKTAFLLNTSLNILKEYPTKEVYLFTFEQSADEILLRALNTYIGVDLNRGSNSRTLLDYYKGRDFIANDRRQIFEERKAAFFQQIAPRLKVVNVEYSANELIDYIEHIRRRTADVVICIDYMQKLRSDRKGKIDGRYTELKFICEDLQAAALPTRTGLPFLIAAQFNRDVVTPLDMQITRIAEASDIEKIASEVIGLWNCTKKIGRKLDQNETKALVEDYKISTKEFRPESAVIIEVLKSRSMSTGHKVKLEYNGNTGLIDADYSKAIKAAITNSVFIAD